MTLYLLILYSLINFCCIKIWRKFINKVPTGIGAILVFPVYFYFFQNNLDFINFFFILILTFIYFLDDLIEIHFSWRILLQILVSFVVYYALENSLNLIFIILSFFILVNSLNFQDGEDLNVALLLFLIFSIFYLYSNDNDIQKTSLVILIFIISFSFFNIKQKNLYFGDSGCYFVSIIIFFFIYKQIDNYNLLKLLISVTIFPLVDVFFVIVYRLLKKENLFKRNFLHLYQVLAKNCNNKFYLLPNILFSFFNIFISQYFDFELTFIIFLTTFNLIMLIVARLLLKIFVKYYEK